MRLMKYLSDVSEELSLTQRWCSYVSLFFLKARAELLERAAADSDVGSVVSTRTAEPAMLSVRWDFSISVIVHNPEHSTQTECSLKTYTRLPRCTFS